MRDNNQAAIDAAGMEQEVTEETELGNEYIQPSKKWLDSRRVSEVM